MVTNYERGRSFEYKVIKYLEEKGAYCIRSSGSHKVCDIIAIFRNGIINFIQCKNNGKISKEEMNKIKNFMQKYKQIVTLYWQEKVDNKYHMKAKDLGYYIIKNDN